MKRYLYASLLIAALAALSSANAHTRTIAVPTTTAPSLSMPAPAAEFVPAVASGALSLTPPIAAAGPATPFLFWLGQAAAATSIDGFIDVAIAVVLGLPTPGAGAHVLNFLTNLLPYAGHASTARRIGELHRAIDRVAGVARRLHKLKVPGADGLLKRINGDLELLLKELRGAKLAAAKQTFYRLLGQLREAQIAEAMDRAGYRIMVLGLKRLDGKGINTDIDLVFRQGSAVIFAQVKAGKGARLGFKSNKWEDFRGQATNTLKAANKYSSIYGTQPRVRYYVDAISDDARDWLDGQGISVVLNHTVLKP
ncbi:MAG: hypothetical protein AAGC55_06790 [Myxococcota bacterium]